MFDSFFSFFEKLILDFSWTRLSFFVILIALVIASILVFEFYTGYFSIGRLEREVALLQELISISEAVNLTDEASRIEYAFMSVLDTYNQRFTSSSLTIGSAPQWLSKFAYSMFPWLCFIFAIFFSDKGGRSSAVAGMLLVGVPISILGANLPDFSEPWINKWLYPWGAAILCIGLVMWWQRGNESNN